MSVSAFYNANLSQINNLIDLVPASIYCKTVDGIYFKVNQTSLNAMSKYGFLNGEITADAMLGKTDFDFFAEPIAAAYRANDIEAIRSRETVCIEENIRLPNGDLLRQISTKKPLLNINNEMIGIMGATIIPPENNHALKKSLSDALTNREKDCLHLYLQGKTSKDTAIILGISSRTVEWHIESLKSKLKCPTKRKLFCYRNLI